MELREAVEKARVEVHDWAIHVQSGKDISTHFSVVSYDNVVKNLVVNFAEKSGERVAARVWPQMEDNPREKFEILTQENLKSALEGCFAWFAIGWVMGSAENQAKPKVKETFISVMHDTPKEELRLLEKRFSSEDFLAERFTISLDNAGVLVSRVFSDAGFDMDRTTISRWCAITSSLPMFEAYELGTRARMLIEEDLAMEHIASQFE